MPPASTDVEEYGRKLSRIGSLRMAVRKRYTLTERRALVPGLLMRTLIASAFIANLLLFAGCALQARIEPCPMPSICFTSAGRRFCPTALAPAFCGCGTISNFCRSRYGIPILSLTLKIGHCAGATRDEVQVKKRFLVPDSKKRPTKNHQTRILHGEGRV